MSKMKLAALAAIAGMVAPAIAQPVNVNNGSFENPDASMGDNPNVAGWGSFNDPATQNVSSDVAFDGTQSLKTFGPFDFIGGGTGVFQTQSAIAGRQYDASVWAQHLSADALGGENFGVLKIEFLDANGQFVSDGMSAAGTPLLGFNVFESTQFNAASFTTDTWHQLTVGGLAPAGTEFINIAIVQVQLGEEVTNPRDPNGPPTREFRGGAIYWDAVTVVPAPGTVAGLGLFGLAAARRRRG